MVLDVFSVVPAVNVVPLPANWMYSIKYDETVRLLVDSGANQKISMVLEVKLFTSGVEGEPGAVSQIQKVRPIYLENCTKCK